MSVSEEDKTAAAAIKTTANEAFKCKPPPTLNAPELTLHVLAGCSKKVHGRSEAVW